MAQFYRRFFIAEEMQHLLALPFLHPIANIYLEMSL